MSASEPRGPTPQQGGQHAAGLHQEGGISPSGTQASSAFSGGTRDDGSTPSMLRNVAILTSSKLVNQPGPVDDSPGSYPMDKLLAKLTEQQAVLNQQNEALRSAEDDKITRVHARTVEHASSSNSLPITPASDVFPAATPSTRPASAAIEDSRPDTDEVLRLKLQLAQAQNRISKLDQELAKTKSFKAETDPQSFTVPRGMPLVSREPTWAPADDSQSDTSDAMSATALNRNRGIWGPSKGGFPNSNTFQPPASEPSAANWFGGRGYGQPFGESNESYPVMDSFRADRAAPDPVQMMRAPAGRRGGRYDHRLSAPNQYTGGFGAMPGPVNQIDPMATQMPMNAPPGLGPMGMGMYSPYQQQPIGTPLSPHASEFTSKAVWKNEAVPAEGPTYLPATEPLNYRRLLDKNVSANWKYIVDKIVCNNDQQASIFLQQKLKVGSPEQKYEIVEAIVAQAYPLMVNRFGNFLVQRCFEHGTPEQVIKIADAIRGNTLNLSMDPFGCHVVQKAFDSVPEDYKAIMVHELLRRIPETVIHRYACHVWQKLFELRWTETPPQIMKYVNEALRGMWHEVALGETGSLVVQNIFENCLEEDKRPCIEEVLANIDIVAHGQFGNWCIQHICEHGAPPDRSRAIDHVIRYAAEYSTDQFASKVVEKCLKIGGTDFLGRYLDRVCEGRRDRTRIPLIDIASDQYGNYLIQWILNNATPQHREMVAAHIRKHMVSLRGSKFGSRVGMLCTNHAVTTRPGPGVGPGMGSRMGPGPRFGGAYR
ncbi:hypothetical protein JDV02_006164 [Purpureocillium takamizusanense]|uniref:PUM-HD domain-containing protein n=1 Tax=Purpureocillium takamizusanense TaxID=2060973 RepID=A0A9Q8QFS7_9HYPO|nr:uncharacterized protein JDV02_006164 [Purpureocillium takamizusanense]UNI20034.1 hypothetical protein JDV02_006164 [Purpureocillium takamizusanense]